MRNQQDIMAERFLGLLRPIERDLELYCRRLVSQDADVADAIQNAVLRAFRAFDRYHDESSFRAWMFKILTNEVFALNRKRGRIAQFEIALEPEALEALAGPAAAADGFEPVSSWEVLAQALDQDLVAALAALHEGERAVLLLRSVGQLGYREIGESLDIPLGTVMGNLHRARQKMRAALLRSHRKELS